jgi:dTDP-4-amino-4,6-dideoxygalactose transaminase
MKKQLIHEQTRSWIPNSKGYFPPASFEYIQQCLEKREKMCGGGPFMAACENLLNTKFSTHSLLVTSATHGLEMACHLTRQFIMSKFPNQKDKKQIIVPSFTYSSCVNAILLAGLEPIFCDVDSISLNMTTQLIAGLVNANTAAIMPVHYAGVMVDMDGIQALANTVGALVIEDASHALGSVYMDSAGRKHCAGTMGDMAVFSFHETKNVQCGEGGVFFTKHQHFYEDALVYRICGYDKDLFIRGLVSSYSWQSVGSNFMLSDISSALLLGGLENIDTINQKRRNLCMVYNQALAPLVESRYIVLPPEEYLLQSACHIHYLQVQTDNMRNELIDYLRSHNIGATFHYIPLHKTPAGLQIAPHTVLPNTEIYVPKTLRLPLFYELTTADITRIAHTIAQFFTSN